MSEDFQPTEPGPTAEQEFQRLSELADARLGVAENLVWPLALGWGCVAGLATQHWLPGLLVFGCAFYFVRRPYAKESDRFDKMHRDKTLGPAQK